MVVKNFVIGALKLFIFCCTAVSGITFETVAFEEIEDCLGAKVVIHRMRGDIGSWVAWPLVVVTAQASDVCPIHSPSALTTPRIPAIRRVRLNFMKLLNAWSRAKMGIRSPILTINFTVIPTVLCFRITLIAYLQCAPCNGRPDKGRKRDQDTQFLTFAFRKGVLYGGEQCWGNSKRDNDKRSSGDCFQRFRGLTSVFQWSVPGLLWYPNGFEH